MGESMTEARGPTQDELVLTSIFGFNTGPARAYLLPLAEDAVFSEPDRLWWEDPPQDGGLYAISSIAFDRDGDGVDEVLTSSAISVDPPGRVQVLRTPGLESADETWTGDYDTLCEVFGENLHSGTGLFAPGSPSFLAGCGLNAARLGTLVIVPPLGPGEFGITDLSTRFIGEIPYDLFGRSAAHGDVNGDGHEDLIVGAPNWYGGQPSDSLLDIRTRGTVYLFYGPFDPGATMTRQDAAAVWVGENVGDYFGWSVAAADLDGDGTDEIYASAPMRPGVNDDGEELRLAGALYRLPAP